MPRSAKRLSSPRKSPLQRSRSRSRRELSQTVRWHTVEWLESRRVLAAPTLAPIQDVTLFAGAPLHIALDGFDADGDALTYTVSSDNALLDMTIPQGNRSLRVTVLHAPSSQSGDQAISGDLVFELFEDLAPRTTARIIELAQQGFYNGLTFHRIASLQDGSPFVIQGGDPSGNGTGGSGVQFDDEFHVLLQHTSAGVLSMAKSSDDTNDSQFFITGQATRFLDFNHSIFGFLTQGDDIRTAIESVPVDGNDKPVSPVFMQSVEVFVDHENGVLRLNAPQGTSGTAMVTVTVSDGNGGTAQQTFQVTIQPDTVNSRPFLSNTPPFIEVAPGGTTNFSLQGSDVEGGPIVFGLTFGQPAGFAITPASTTVPPVGQIATAGFTVTATTATPGVYSVSVYAVAGDQQVTGVADADTQLIPLLVTGIDLLSDTGSSTTDNITNLNNTSGKTLDFMVIGISEGDQIVLKAGSTVIGQGTGGADRTVTITTNGTAPLAEGQHTIRAFVVNNGVETEILQPLTITVNTETPVFTSSPILTAFAGSPYVYNAQTTQEGLAGHVYSLVTRPTGMTIDPATGQVSWTPSASQANAHPVVIRATNGAGNVIEQAFDVFVLVAPQLAIAGVNTTVNEGETFEFSIAPFVSDANLPGDSFTYSLGPGAPAGATINASTGLFRWTTTESDGPAQVPITFRVTDASGLTATQTLTLTVVEQNTPPTLNPISDRVVDEHSLVTFQVQAFDPDLPAQTLTFNLLPGAPTGATIHPTTGVFRWIPSEEQGPGVFDITVRVSDGQGGFDFRSFTIIVREVNDTPILEPIAPQFILPGGLVEFQAVGYDPDIPFQEVRFSLEPDAPEGATIDPLTGEFRWQTEEDQPLGVVSFTIRLTEVTEQGLFTTQVVQVVVGNFTDAVFPGGPASAEAILFDSALGDSIPLSLSQNGTLPTAPGSGPLDLPTTAAGPVVGAPNFTRGPDTGVPHLVRPEELPTEAERAAEEVRRAAESQRPDHTETKSDAQPVSQQATPAEDELAAALVQAAQDDAFDAALELTDADDPVGETHDEAAAPVQAADEASRASLPPDGQPAAGAILPLVMAPAVTAQHNEKSQARRTPKARRSAR